MFDDVIVCRRDGSEVPPRRHRKDSSEYRLMKTRRLAQVLPLVPGRHHTVQSQGNHGQEEPTLYLAPACV